MRKFRRQRINPTSPSSSSSRQQLIPTTPQLPPSSSSSTSAAALIPTLGVLVLHHHLLDKNLSDLVAQYARGKKSFPPINDEETLLKKMPKTLWNLVNQYVVLFKEVGEWYELQNKWYEAFLFYYHAIKYEQSAIATYKVGMCYLWGMNAIQIDWNKAVQFLEIASAAGINEATSLLSTCYTSGAGVPHNQAKAEAIEAIAIHEHHEKKLACAATDPRAAWHLAVLFGNGYNFSYNEEQVDKWLNFAAECGHADAQLRMALVMEAKKNKTKEQQEWALELLKRSAEQNYPPALNSLAMRHESGKMGLVKDLKEAARYYQKSANANYPDGQRHLGICFRDGIGVPVDLDAARYWLRLAMYGGLGFAIHDLP